MQFKTKIEKLDTEEIVKSEYINWNHFKNSTILVTGATGLIGSQIVRSMLYANEIKGANIKIAALVRNKKKAEKIFGLNSKNIFFVVQDITKQISKGIHPDFIIHTANGTSSKDFTEQPVETIDSIVTGTKNVLEFAKKEKVKSLVYLSSMEVYGKTDFERKEPLKENDYGYLDLYNTRNSYPEGKRLAENMCFAYAKEYNLPVKIARLSQTIGAGVDIKDNRVFAQFARNIVLREDIVLHTEGDTIRSYIYITDCITAIFNLLEKGENGETYNIANSDTTCSIRDMAEMLCKKYTSSKLKIELDEKYYPEKSKLFLDTTKLNELGWGSHINLEEMFNRLIQDFYLRDKELIIKTKKRKLSDIIIKFIFDITNDAEYKKLTILGKSFRWKRKPKYDDLSDKININENKVVLFDTQGSGFCGHLKYVALEILNKMPWAELVWIDRFSDTITPDFPPNIKLVQTNTKEALEEFASAKIWIATQRPIKLVRDGLKKKKGQYYIQLWHGSLGIKKIGFDINPLKEDLTDRLLKKDAINLDYAVSNSEFENNVYRGLFYDQGKTILLGHARNDIFFKDNSKIKDKVFQKLNLDKNKKTILYVPTFRDNRDVTCYDMDYPKIISAFEEKYANEFVLILRFHPIALKLCKNFSFDNPKIINGNQYDDIQELLAVSDFCITDYSSCIFDFMLTRKPGFIYASDIEDYTSKHGFYYPLENTPFPISETNKDLIDNIHNFNYDEYKTKLDMFLEDKKCMDDGHASERIVHFIKDIMEKKCK